MKTIKSIVVVLFVLLVAQIASAYYCPSTGRWLSRDPMGEPGFQALQTASAMPQSGSSGSLPPGRWINRDPILEQQAGSAYGFIANDSANSVDELGLVVVNLKYEAYIETSKVTFGIPLVSKPRTFNGGVKIRHSVNVDTDANSITEVEKYIGPTIEYGAHGNIINQGQASGSTVKAYIVAKDNLHLTVVMEGNEGNPLVTKAPGITYQVSINFDKCSTKISWLGSHDRFPSHDFYEQGNQAHHFSHVTAGTSPWSLFPFMPDETFYGFDTF